MRKVKDGILRILRVVGVRRQCSIVLPILVILMMYLEWLLGGDVVHCADSILVVKRRWHSDYELWPSSFNRKENEEVVAICVDLKNVAMEKI